MQNGIKAWTNWPLALICCLLFSISEVTAQERHSYMVINGFRVDETETKSTLMTRLRENFSVRDVTPMSDAVIAPGQSSVLIWERKGEEVSGFPPDRPLAQADFLNEKLVSFTRYWYPSGTNGFPEILISALESAAGSNRVCSIGLIEVPNGGKQTRIICRKTELRIFPDVITERLKP